MIFNIIFKLSSIENRDHQTRICQDEERKQSPNNRNKQQKKTTANYIYNIRNAKQASDYKAVTNYIINTIISKANYPDNIGDTLKSGNLQNIEKWRPELRVSDSKDQTIRTCKDKQFGMEFQSNYDKYCTRVKTYNANSIHAYAKLWKHCSKSLQQKITSMSTFDSTIKNKPLSLLSAIKKHALSFQEDQYEMRIILDSLTNFIMTKQRDDKHLDNYSTRFKGAQDKLKEHLGGPIILTKYINTLSDYNEKNNEAIKKCMKTGFKEVMAYMFMKNTDQKKYSSILKGLHAQKNLKNSQYPKVLADAIQVLSKHPFDNSMELKKRRPH